MFGFLVESKHFQLFLKDDFSLVTSWVKLLVFGFSAERGRLFLSEPGGLGGHSRPAQLSCNEPVTTIL